jgi:hypothetical protein
MREHSPKLVFLLSSGLFWPSDLRDPKDGSWESICDRNLVDALGRLSSTSANLSTHQSSIRALIAFGPPEIGVDVRGYQSYRAIPAIMQGICREYDLYRV